MQEAGMDSMTESTQSLHESLSAAMDGEAEELELRRVLNAAGRDPALNAKWQRLHLIQSAMRGHVGTVVAAHGRQRPWLEASSPEPVSDASAAAPAPSQAVATNGNRWLASRWLKSLTSVAAAAAAAFAVVTYFGDSNPIEPTPPSAALAASETVPPRTLAHVPSETDLRRANAYLLKHAQHSTLATRPAVIPFAKVLAARQPNAGSSREIPVEAPIATANRPTPKPR